MYTNWSPKRQQKPAAMAETVDPEATTSDSSESNKASLPEGPAMPKAKESIKLEPDSSKEIPVRSPASSPEYDPWATPKPHADNLIDIPKNISQAHGYDARRPDWFDIWDISAKPFVSHSQRQKEQQLCFFVVQRPAWLPFEACIGDRHLYQKPYMADKDKLQKPNMATSSKSNLLATSYFSYHSHVYATPGKVSPSFHIISLQVAL